MMDMKKHKLKHARQCQMGGCKNKNTDIYSRRNNAFDGGIYLCPDCARDIGLLNGLVEESSVGRSGAVLSDVDTDKAETPETKQNAPESFEEAVKRGKAKR